MKQQKKTKIFYTDWAGTFEDLSDKDAKRLIIALLKCTPEENIECYFPIGDALRPTFRAMKSALDATAAKYNETVQKRREAGRMGGLAKSAKNKFNSIDTSTGEVFVPTDEPMTSDLTIDTLLENEQDGLKFDENKEIETSNDTNIQKENIVEKKADFETNTTLTEFIMSRPEGMMRCKQWNNFVNLYPDAEKIQKISGITDLSAVNLYKQLKESAFSFGK